MRILYFNYKSKPDKKESRDIFERILFTIFIALLTLVIFSQVSFLQSGNSNLALARDASEGAPLGAEEYLYASGTVELRLMSGENAPGLIVLINGEKAAIFDNRDIKLEVIEGDVIELDGSDCDECDVAVCAVSGNLKKDALGQVFSVNKRVERVLKVEVTAKE